MIQKDFEKDDLLNFKPLIFKPKSMFTRGYVMIKDSDIEEFKSSEYFKYFNLYQTKDDMATYVKDIDESAYYDKYTNEIKTKESVFDTKITYQGDIYTIDYKKMWEDNFEQLSFGQFKRAFFNGELKGFEIAHLCLPEHLLSISTLERKGKKIKFGEVIEKSEKILKAIEDGISEYAYETKKLKISDIATIIKNANVIDLDEIEYVIAAENYIKIMNMFNNVNGFNSGRVFIHNSISDTYTIVSYNGIKNKTRKIIKHIKSIFVAVKNGDRRLILLHDDNKNIVDQNDMAVAQLLEIFRLTNYEVISGEKPEYFVRINSISAIERILENKYYQSSMVSLVAKRHADSIEKMKHFFVELDNDKDRWDYIEQYFVGEI